jgi:hypothetical protein
MLKIFMPTIIMAKNGIFTQNKVMPKVDHNIGFSEKCNFFRRKPQKIVIITSVPARLTVPFSSLGT